MITGFHNDNDERYFEPVAPGRRGVATGPGPVVTGAPGVNGGSGGRWQPHVPHRPVTLGPAARASWTVLMIAALAAVGWAIYAISQAMGVVMMMGGSCAGAGTGYDLPECPSGTGGHIVLGVLGGLLAAGLAGVAAARLGRRQLVLFAWPALFALLGWNFLEFALRPATKGAASVSTNWLICGLVFEAMAFFPLVGGVIIALRSLSRSRATRTPSRETPVVQR